MRPLTAQSIVHRFYDVTRRREWVGAGVCVENANDDEFRGVRELLPGAQA